MLDKLEGIKARFDELGVALTNPEIVSDNKKYTAISREYRSLEKIVKVRNEYAKVLDDIEFNKEVLSSDDKEMRDLAKEELPGLEEKKEEVEKNIRTMLIPKDPLDEKNCILEIRAGTGGDEAGHRCAASVLTEITPHRWARWVKLDPGRQPTDCRAEELAALLPDV